MSISSSSRANSERRKGTIYAAAQKLLGDHLENLSRPLGQKLGPDVIKEIMMIQSSLDAAEVYRLDAIENDLSRSSEYQTMSRHADRSYRNFQLPARVTYLEDLVSGMLIIDPQTGLRGLEAERYFLRICTFQAARNMLSRNSPGQLNTAFLELSEPEGSLAFTRGTVHFESNIFPAETRPLVILSIVTDMALTPRGVITFERDLTPPTNLRAPGADTWRSLGVDLPCAYREIAYAMKNKNIRPI